MKEVYPGIFCIKEKGWFGIIKPSVNIYVITGRDGLVYDAGYGAKVDIKKFAEQYNKINNICKDRGYENTINRILLSHAHVDHFSGLKGLRDKLGFKVIVTDEMKHIISSSKNYRSSYELPDLDNIKSARPGVVDFISYELSFSYSIKSIFRRILKVLKSAFREIEFYFYSLFWGISYVEYPDIIIDSETEIVINDETWHISGSPGHSDEHIILYNKDKGILFSGDNVLRSINVWLGPPKSDLDQYIDSLKKMIDLPNLKIILPAHGNPVDKPYERLNKIIDWRIKRTEDVYEILKNSSPKKLSVKDILEILYPNDKRLKKRFAEGWVELTLNKFEKENKILRDGDRFFYREE